MVHPLPLGRPLEVGAASDSRPATACPPRPPEILGRLPAQKGREGPSSRIISVSETSVRLRERMIIEQHHAVINHLGHDVVGLWLAVERKLEAVEDPEISWHMETSEIGRLWSLLRARARRDVLVISHARFREFLVGIFSTAHGRALHVTRTVYATPRLRNDFRRALRLRAEPGTRFDLGNELDLHSVMDLRAFVNITRIVLNEAIQELTGQQFGEETDQDMLE